MRSCMTLLAACLLLALQPILAAGSAATCPAVRIETRKTVVANSKMLVRVKMENPNPRQSMDGVGLTVFLPPDVLFIRSASRKANHAAPSQDGHVLSWSNLRLKRALTFNIKVNVTAGAYNTLGRPIVFNARSSLAAAPCTAAAAPKSVAVKPPKRTAAKKPNIIFFIIDDLGIDQLELFGYGGTPPRAATPALDALADAGVRFRNFWSLPDCSPTRTAAFTGRYPIRTNVTTALLAPDLAGNQLKPYELTTPTVLRQAGYVSALFGKAHFTNTPSDQYPTTAPYGATPVTQLGWDYFNGWNDGGPLSIDTTAGGAGAPGQYPCGFVPGSVSGACHYINGTCAFKQPTTPYAAYPGLDCLSEGGILLPGETCGQPPSVDLAFDNDNGYYVGQAVIIPNRQSEAQIFPPGQSEIGRRYRTQRETRAAVRWINDQKRGGSPWMATVSFSSVHTPLQQTPPGMDYGSAASTNGVPCVNGTVSDNWKLMNSMIEATDEALAQVLVETGVMFADPNGSYTYNKDSNTVVIVMGDNGSYGPTVRLPFNPLLAKAYVYQTGTWAPMMVTGAMVDRPGRTNEEMTSVVDLFGLFNELAGVDAQDYLDGRPVAIDSQPLLPYLTNAQQPPIRNTSFTYTSDNYRGTNFTNGACVLESLNSCTTLFYSKYVCVNLYGGVWYGAGNNISWVPTDGYTSCCDLNKAIYDGLGSPTITAPYEVLPSIQMAVRSAAYKLVNIVTDDYDNATQQCVTINSEEFYRINQDSPTPLLEDPTGTPLFASTSPNLLLQPGALTPEQTDILAALRSERDSLLSSALPCPGDANLDGVVDGLDLAQMLEWMEITNNGSTWWDLDLNGVTNEVDVGILTGLLGTTCPSMR